MGSGMGIKCGAGKRRIRRKSVGMWDRQWDGSGGVGGGAECDSTDSKEQEGVSG